MQDDKVLKQIIQTLSSVIGVDESELSISSDIKNTSSWDSYNHVMFVMQICEQFSIEFNQEIIMDFTSVRKIYNHIKGEK